MAERRPPPNSGSIRGLYPSSETNLLLGEILSELRQLRNDLRKGTREMSQEIQAAVTELQAELVEITAENASAIALIEGQNKIILASIDNAADDAAAVVGVRAAVAAFAAQRKGLADAVLANTPSDPSPQPLAPNAST